MRTGFGGGGSLGLLNKLAMFTSFVAGSGSWRLRTP
jgi:hypothetical protein